MRHNPASHRRDAHAKAGLIRGKCRGVALVIILAFLVLLSGVVVAFFSRAISERQVSNSSVNQTKAEILAQGALEQIVGDLKQEIADGSTPTTVGVTTIYSPNSPASMVPELAGSSGTGGLENLVKRSAHGIAFSVGGSQRAANVSTMSPSKNGRSISPARWNKPLLLPKSPTDAQDYTPVLTSGTFPAPDWIFVARDGSNPTGWDPNMISTGTNPTAVVGRYAYMVYDGSGLLDMNVSGYPTAATSIHIGSKIGLAYADLTQLTDSAGTQLLSQSKIDNIVGWRNFASASTDWTKTPPVLSSPALSGFPGSGTAGWAGAPASGTNYFQFTLQNKMGYLSTENPLLNNGQSDRFFASRQELMRFLLGTIASQAATTAGKTDRATVQNALQYLTHFSRALNAPSWKPTATVGTPTGNTIDYAGQADNPSRVNRNLPNVRFANTATITHYDDNGLASTYSVAAGEPLIQRRFSLAKLAWLTPDGTPPAGISAAAIQACFGLTWDNAKWRWEYVAAKAPPGVAIKTLEQVAAEIPAREPNFFEMLNAGILSGSLGRDPGLGIDQTATGRIGVYASHFDIYKTEPNLQILQIGANIIDQADNDSYPTAIHLNTFGMTGADDLAIQTVYGDENLPGLLGLLPISIADPVPQAEGDANGVLKSWLQPQIWNPHQAPKSGVTLPGFPSGFRAYAYGDIYCMWYDNGVPDSKRVFRFNEKTNYDDGTGSGAHKDLGSIYFTDTGNSSSPFYNNPRELTVDMVDGSTPAANQYKAIWASLPADQGKLNKFVGFALSPVTAYDSGPTTKPAKFFLPDPVVYFSLQYKGMDNQYHPYNFMARIGQSSTQSGKYMHPSPEGNVSGSTPYDQVVGQTMTDGWGPVRPDPRTDRFSVATQWWANAQSGGRGNSMNPKPDSYIGPHGSGAGGGGDFGIPNMPGIFYYDPEYTIANVDANDFNRPRPGLWARNDPSFAITGQNPSYGRNAYYADPDGVVRYGDVYRANTATGDGSELYHVDAPVTDYAGKKNVKPTLTDPKNTSAQARRPVILNRPFRSVGELGFAYRDLPFKSLDFWSPTSADGALLDLFSVNDQPAVVAGQINPNSARAQVLQAILAGGSKNSDSLNLQISTADAKTLAMYPGITTDLTANGPYMSRADLATRLGPLISGSGTGVAFDTTVAANANWANKAHAEAPVRALADVTNTRTWNLMIDVIAQTGIFPPNATSLGGFFVQGERRYWLHVAIDRFTGKIVDQQLEPVYE